MTRYSLLDLVPVVEGGTVAQALANAADLAAHAEAVGFHRYWTAEHHGMAGIASAATAVVLAHVGQATKTIRIKKISVAGAATAAGTMPIVVEKCSDAGTIGAAVLTAAALVPHDSTSAAATGSFGTIGTANYGTPPAVVGIVGVGPIAVQLLELGEQQRQVVERIGPLRMPCNLRDLPGRELGIQILGQCLTLLLQTLDFLGNVDGRVVLDVTKLFDLGLQLRNRLFEIQEGHFHAFCGRV